MDDDIPLEPASQAAPKSVAGNRSGPTPKYTAPHAASRGHATVEPPRRGFLMKLLTLLIGGLATFVPVAAGLATFLDPLRRKSSAGHSLPVAPLDALPADGVPRLFPVIADRDDAWNRFADEPIGAVYLRRTEDENQVTALNAICPHAGCFVDFNRDAGNYRCPCHTSGFEVDGDRIMPCVAPRDLDELACEVREVEGQQVIYVAFQNFYSGLEEQVPKA